MLRGGADLLGVVGRSLDTQNSGMDIVEFPSENQLNQARAWDKACGCLRERSGALHTRDEGWQVIHRVGRVDGGGGGFGCGLASTNLSFSVVHVDLKGWAEGA